MNGERYLIVNADDFGLSPGVNRGIIECHENGIVTSASLMVRWPAAAEAAEYARARPRLGVGLHIDLGEWAYRNEEWTCLYEVVPTGDPAAVAEHVVRQVDAFRRLMGRDPTHLDSHQHVHREEPARSAVLKAAAKIGIPVRHFSSGIHYCGEFYGQDGKGKTCPGAVTTAALLQALAELPIGATEMACHPGYAEDLDTMYRFERADEVAALCDSRVRAAVEAAGIILSTFATVRGKWSATVAIEADPVYR